MKTIHSLFVVALLGLVSCDSLVREVNPDLIPAATAKLVVHSYLSPQDTVLAVVVETPSAVIGQRDVNGGNRRYLGTATVNLSDGSRTVRLPFSVKDQLYRIAARELAIVAGRTYTLTVSAPNFPTTTAQCTVPAPVKPTEVRVDSVRRKQGQGTSVQYLARLLWRDQPGAANYYAVDGSMFLDVTRLNFREPNPQLRRDTTITEQRRLSIDSGNSVLTDQNRDGQQLISGTFRDFQNYYEGSNASGKISNQRITMILSAVDENCYRYRLAVEQQRDIDENPFAEPVLIPGNIRNGLGCFGAVNQSPLTVRVR